MAKWSNIKLSNIPFFLVYQKIEATSSAKVTDTNKKQMIKDQLKKLESALKKKAMSK